MERISISIHFSTAQDWSREGMSSSVEGPMIEGRHQGTITCSANHLTAFSVLLTPTGINFSRHHDLALSIITYVGLLLSTIGLIATVATYALFK